MAGEAEVGQERGRGGQRDPLRPSALRVVLLLLGAAYCLLAFGVAFAGGLWPIFWRSHVRREYLDRAAAQDPTIDFASAEWLDYGMWGTPDLSGAGLPGYAGEAVPIALVMAPVVFAAAHILVTWLAAGLALRADRRLDLKLGERPALSLAAAVMVRVLFTWTPLLCAVCGLAAGFSYLGAAQNNLLSAYRLEWVPLTGVALAIIAVLVGDALISVSAVRNSLQRIAPVQSRLCNGCGYSLRGLPATAQACPECGRVLLANRTVVSMVMSPRMWRVLRWGSMAALALSVTGLIALLVYSPTSRSLAGAWITVRGEWAGAGGASVIAPDGAVVKVTDGVTTAYLSARTVGSLGSLERGTLRARAIAPDPAGGGLTRNEVRFHIHVWAPTGSLISTPAALQTMHRWGKDCYYARLYAWPAVPLSATFAQRDELTPNDWAWLTEVLPAPEATAPEASPAAND